MNDVAASQVISSILETACGPRRRRPTEADLPVVGDDEKRARNRMEKFWITLLHEAFACYYEGNKDVVVLSKAYREPGWMRSEFLHDIAVVERRQIPSTYLGNLLPVARRVLWQVESELSRNGRQVAIDFSKLVAGSAESKLLVVRRPVELQTDGQKRVCKFVERMAEACTGNILLAFLPTYAMSHPDLKYWKAEGRLPIALFVKDLAGVMQPVCTTSQTD